jgi:alpha-glucosidase (family GH31 glycosyl hydrolase)
MDAFSDFTVDKKAFPTLKKFTQDIQKDGKRMVVIVDAGISGDKTDNKYYKAA